MDLRDYGLGAQILFDLGVRKFRFLTNNPKKVVGLEGYGIQMVEQVPIRSEANPHNEKYLETQARENGAHALALPPLRLFRNVDRCPAAPPSRIGKRVFPIVASQYNPEYVAGSRESRDRRTSESLPRRRAHLHQVPGAFEIPIVVRELARQKRGDAIIAIGVISKGAPATPSISAPQLRTRSSRSRSITACR
jgi:hypothetical protein